MTSIHKHSQPLIHELRNYVAQTPIGPPRAAETEEQFTARVVRPYVDRFVKGTRSPGLAVRSDGQQQPLRVQVNGITAIPDVEIGEGRDVLLAVEVKFIRDQDPSGSLTKALGQAVLYRNLRAHQAAVMLIDLRSSRAENKRGPLVFAPAICDVTVFWFTPSGDGSFIAL
jgi:hypothetical protein